MRFEPPHAIPNKLSCKLLFLQRTKQRRNGRQSGTASEDETATLVCCLLALLRLCHPRKNLTGKVKLFTLTQAFPQQPLPNFEPASISHRSGSPIAPTEMATSQAEYYYPVLKPSLS